MALLSLRDVSLAFGGPRLLDRVDLQIERGERVCLLGRNGEGKSTLLRLIEGEIEPDEGEVIRQQGLRIARLPQEVPEGQGGTVADEVAAGLDDGPRPRGGAHDHRVDAVISRMGLDADARFADLSSGMKRRVLLAQVARRRARHPAARRADQPSRHRRDPLARRLPAPLRRDAGLRHARPGVPGAAGHPDRRARPRPALRLGLRLPDLPQAQGGSARGRGAAERPLRQEAGPGGSLDPQGHRGPPDPQRGPRPGAEGDARGPPQAPGAARRRRGCRSRRPSARARWSSRPRGVGFRYGDRTGDPGLDDDDHAGRQGRDHRPQRLGQDDAAPALARRAAAPGGDDPARDQPGGRLLRPVEGHARRGEDGPAERQRVRHDRDQRPAPARHRLPAGLPLPARAIARAWSSSSPAASGAGCCWPSCSPARRTSWSSTSRPTTSTSRRWSCWRACWSTTRGRCCWSATTGRSSTTW